MHEGKRREGLKMIKYLLPIFGLIVLVNAAKFQTEGVQGLNPQNDPIYDPQTDFLGFQIDAPNPVSRIIGPIKKEKFSKIKPFEKRILPSIAAVSPLKIPNDVENSFPFDIFTPISSPTEKLSVLFPYEVMPSSPLLKSPNEISFKNEDYDLKYHVPAKCQNYLRLWDFYIGGLENNNEIIGWISRLGYARDMVEELNLSTTNCIYSLIPSRFRDREYFLSLLSSAHYLEIAVERPRAFHSMFMLSSIVEPRIKKGSIIAVNLIFLAECAIIRIIIDREKEGTGFFSIQRTLFNDFPFVSEYIPYSSQDFQL